MKSGAVHSADVHSAELSDFKNPLAGPLIVFLSFIGLALFTWHKGGEPFTDFGHQLYLAWRLSEGDILYRDIPWLFGPLAHICNAAVLAVSGLSVGHILIANLAIIAVLSAAVYALALRLANHFTATLTTIAVLVIFCFGHVLEEGVFNFLTPYSHDATYGLTICILLILCCDAWANSNRPWHAFFAGLCAGLTLLTKVELAAGAFLLLLLFAVFSRALKLKLAGITLLIAGIGLPPLAVFLFFLQSMPAADAVSAALAAFSQVARGGEQVVFEPYQLKGLGLDNWKENFSTLVLMCWYGIALTGAGLTVDFALRRSKFAVPIAFAAALVLFTALYSKSALLPWLDAPRFLSLLCPALLIASFIAVLAKHHSPTSRRKALTALLCLSLACILLLRMGLRARFYHYGFFLALPATASLLVTYLHIVPKMIRSRGGNGNPFRILAAAFFLVGICIYLRYSEHYFSARTAPIGSGNDQLYLLAPETSERTRLASLVRHELEHSTNSFETLSVIPSGAFLNYFLRQTNPSGLPILDLNVLRIHGEEEILRRYKAAPPTRILVVEIEELSFGEDTSSRYSRLLPGFWNWLEENYPARMEFLANDGRLFARLYQKSAAPALSSD